DPATRRLLRELQGLSIVDLAAYIGTDGENLADWEANEPPAGDEMADKYRRIMHWMWQSLGTFRPAWTSTTHTLTLLREMGIAPHHAGVRRATSLVRDNSKWEHDGQDYFDGEVEPCINGKTVATGTYFGQNVDAIVERLLGEQLEDGGWNCEAENGSV